MNKKLFCVLEAGAVPNQEITLEHIKQFNTPYSDFYRLNWYTKKDPNANFIHKWTVISENRNYLYHKTKGKYEYYIFIDEDVRFSCRYGDDVAKKIKYYLLKYYPIQASFSSNYRNTSRTDLNSEAYGLLYRDMDVIIMSADYANICYPLVYHGAYGIHFYWDFILLQLYPEKYHVYMDIYADNEFHGSQYYGKGKIINKKIPPNYNQWDPVYNASENIIKSTYIKKWKEHGKIRVESAYIKSAYKGLRINENCIPSSAKKHIKLEEVGKIIDVKHSDFVNRKITLSLRDKRKILYLASRVSKNHIVNKYFIKLIGKKRLQKFFKWFFA